MKAVSETVAFALGLVLIWSGWIHFQNPYDFFSSIQDYALIGRTGSAVAAALLPGLMLVVGGSMVFGVWRAGANVLGAFFFLLFATVQSTALLREMKISCGCFGPNSHDISIFSVVIWGASGIFLFIREVLKSRLGKAYISHLERKTSEGSLNV